MGVRTGMGKLVPGPVGRTMIGVIIFFVVASIIYRRLLDPELLAKAVEWHTRRVLFSKTNGQLCETDSVFNMMASPAIFSAEDKRPELNPLFLQHPHYMTSLKVLERYNSILETTPRAQRKFLECSLGGGLGNHLLDFLHCTFLAIVTNRTLAFSKTRFPPSLKVGLPFVRVGDGFEPRTVGGITTLWDERAFMCCDLNCFIGNDQNAFAFLLPGGSCFWMVGHLLRYNPHYKDWMKASFGNMPYALMANHIFRPSPILVQQINGMFEKSGKRVQIAFHIRAGRDESDLYRSIPVHSFARAAIACAKPWTERSASFGIYLATDSDLVREEFLKAFGKDAMVGLGIHGSTPPDNGKDDVLMTDMWTCIKADYFIGTFFSSITTHIALQRMGGGKLLLRDGSCHSYTNKEPIWPASKIVIDTMYPTLWDVVPKESCGIQPVNQANVLSQLADDFGFSV